MTSNPGILIYVEDPGAANYVAHLPETFHQQGWKTRLLAHGNAKTTLNNLNTPFESINGNVNSDAIFQSNKPTLVMVGTSENPDTLGFELIKGAKKRNIENVGIIDAFVNAPYRFRGRSDNALHHAPNWLIVPDEWTKEAYINLDYDPSHIQVCGHPHYDKVYEISLQLKKENRLEMRRQLLPSYQKNQKVVVLLAEISSGLNPQQFIKNNDYTLSGRGKSVRRTDIVIEEFLDAIQTLQTRPYLILRLHPKNNKEEFSSYLEDFDYVSNSGSPLELIYTADLVVGMTTILLLEAAIIGCSTLSIVPRKSEKKWLPTIRSGMTHCATTRKEVKKKLSNLLRDYQKTSQSNVSNIVTLNSLNIMVEFIRNFF